MPEPSPDGGGGGGAYWEGSTGQGTRRPAPEADSGRWFPQYLEEQQDEPGIRAQGLG
jgi:hypothetical protein